MTLQELVDKEIFVPHSESDQIPPNSLVIRNLGLHKCYPIKLRAFLGRKATEVQQELIEKFPNRKTSPPLMSKPL